MYRYVDALFGYVLGFMCGLAVTAIVIWEVF